MATKKSETAAKTRRPKPPRIVQVAYTVSADVLLELDGKRFRLRAPGPTRRAVPLVVDADTWAKLKTLPAMAALLARGAAREVA